VSDAPSVDALLATLNATEVGSLDSVAEKVHQVERGLQSLGGAVKALRRGDVAEWKRARAFLQSKIGHLR
jgi:hypothetical protein